MTVTSASRRRAMVGAALIAGALVVAGCGTEPATMPEPVAERLDALDAAVAEWRSADDLDAAHRSAEASRNLIVGEGGPGYGDADGDGTVSGASEIGLLPGLSGEVGLTQPPLNTCVARDVLGGEWDDPSARWDEVDDVLAAWSRENNTMPQLASHPQRVVGWATLALAADSLDVAREYAGHAQLHVDVTRSAYASCAE